MLTFSNLVQELKVDFEMQIGLERLRLNDALSARDAVVKHFAHACISIQQKSAAIQQLRDENRRLEQKLQSLQCSETFASSEIVFADGVKQKIVAEIQKLTDIIEHLQENTLSTGQLEGIQTGSSSPDTGSVVSIQVVTTCMRFKLIIYSSTG